MVERIRPTEFAPAMDIARVVTGETAALDVYLSLARKLVSSKLGDQLAALPISDAHKQQLIEAEAYSMAQPAHLKDAGVYRPVRLLSMLDEIGAFEQS